MEKSIANNKDLFLFFDILSPQEAQIYKGQKLFWKDFPKPPHYCAFKSPEVGQGQRGNRIWDSQGTTGNMKVLSCPSCSLERRTYLGSLSISFRVTERGRVRTWMYNSWVYSFVYSWWLGAWPPLPLPLHCCCKLGLNVFNFPVENAVQILPTK